MSLFGIYIHIPYCIQRCSYCDFATYERSSIFPPEDYIELVKKEIRAYVHLHPKKQLDTVYFGGGTPSLIPARLIIAVLDELAKHGLVTGPQTEITVEINPATLDREKMNLYLNKGVNRFSVGAQTFDDKLLKSVKREHNSQATRETLDFLASNNVNYTFDLLFGLPGQTLAGLKHDLDIVSEYRPKHLSPYCLTVPENHPLSKGRPPEETQIEMFNLIEDRLTALGMERYEISNFAKPGFESRHNLLYWTDESYWGIGLSAHSYSKFSQFGERFWNPNSIDSYVKKIKELDIDNGNFSSILDGRKADEYELLKTHQALTDFCHTSLRLKRGLSKQKLSEKFGPTVVSLVSEQCDMMLTLGWLDQLEDQMGTHWFLTKKGVLISNQIFSKLTFLAEDLKKG